jgi:hypothetical protein
MTRLLNTIRPGDDEEELFEECECGECSFEDFDGCLCNRTRVEPILNGVRSSADNAAWTGVAWNPKSTR